MTKTKKDNSSPVEEHVLHEWRAPEFIQQKKGAKWYLTAGIILGLLLLLTIFYSNWTLTIVLVVLAGVYLYLQKKHPPKEITVKITDMGIYVGHMYFQYSHIKAFWIIAENGVKTLNLLIPKRYISEVKIQLMDQNPAAIRRILITQIPEMEGKHENVIDVLARLLKI
ncbi:hypothetical protein GF340_02700 [Candidatus Peregrinibacteria bacterium]|nr:hypothetical protein [Candidatus Peregrinibacteria bacterium]